MILFNNVYLPKMELLLYVRELWCAGIAMYRSLKMLKSCFGGYAIWRSCGARELRCGGIADFIKLSVLRRLLGKIHVMANNEA